MSTQIPGDGRTWGHHFITGNFKQIFEHDMPKVLGIGKDALAVLEKGWENLEPKLKDALVNAAGIVNEISVDLDKVPDEVIKAIQTKFPTVSLDKLKDLLMKIEAFIVKAETVPDQSLEETIKNIQSYFKTLGISPAVTRIKSQIAQTIASLLSPDSPFAKIVSYIELAFRVFAKNRQ